MTKSLTRLVTSGCAALLCLVGPGISAAASADYPEIAARIRLYVQMGEQYVVRQFNDEAIRAFRTAADLMHQYGDPVGRQLAMIEYLARLDDTAGVTERLQRLLDADPGNAEARALMARLKPAAVPVPVTVEQKLPPGPGQRQRLELFIQMGNDYSAHNMNAEAVQAFRAAARISLELDLPVADQLALIEHLASLQDMAGAMEALRNVVAKYPDDQQARTLHAKYLAWNGQPSAAIKEVDVVLAANPSNKDAILVKANAADWQGDQATALPLYEKLLEEEENFDVRLAYTGALLKTGNNEKAQQNMGQLIPSSDAQNRALNDLEWYLRRQTAQNFQFRQEFYSDTGSTDISKTLVSFEFPLRTSSLGFRLGQARTSDVFQAVDSREFGINGNARYSDSTTISGSIGTLELDADQGDGVFTSSVETRTRLPQLDTLLSVSRQPETGSTWVLLNEKITDKLRGVAVYNPLQRWTLDADLSFARDSVDDRYTRLISAARYLLYSGAAQLQAGLRRDAQDSRQHAWWGDIFRTERISHDLLLSVSMSKNRFYSGVELFYGDEKYTAFDASQHSDHAGWYATTQYQWVKGFFVEAQWEGTIYGVDQDNPFSYRQLNLRAISYF